MNEISLFVLLNILGFTASSLIDKKLSAIPRADSPFSAALYKLPVTALLFAPFALLSWEQTVADGGYLLLAGAVLGVIFAFDFELYYRGLRSGEVSVLFPFYLSGGVALTYVLSLMLFTEAPTLLRTLGTLGVILGNVLLIRPPVQNADGATDRAPILSLLTRIKKNGLLYFSGAVALTVAGNLLSKSVSFGVEDGFALAGWSYIFTVLTLFVINGPRLTANMSEYLNLWRVFLAHWRLLALGALTGLLGRWFLYAALIKGGDATYVFPFSDGGHLLALALAAALFLREKISLQKGAAVVILFLSVLAIASSFN